MAEAKAPVFNARRSESGFMSASQAPLQITEHNVIDELIQGCEHNAS
jgi:hypothetical protein